uniref:Uncharacterized protein n=1 Tax=Rhizophagus irregularis (strain DAOM 181602 / DAOM 197198 / MUCL 43194) TaxID=747089 RepID=U9TMX9_RHIID
MMEDHDAQQAKELLGPGWTVPGILLNSWKMISKLKNPYQPQDEKDAISSTSILQINGLCYTFTTLLIQSLEFNSAEPMIERLEFERTELIVDNVDLEEIFEKYRSECENNLSEYCTLQNLEKGITFGFADFYYSLAKLEEWIGAGKSFAVNHVISDLPK